MRLSRFTDWLEAQKAIDRLARPAHDAAHRILPGGALKDILSGTALGHPLHPILVMVPIGSWTSASLIDAAAGGRSTTAARRLLAFGILTALPAACSGIADWSDTTGSEQRVGLTHAALNTVALALYGASWWARRRPGRAGPVLALAGMAAATGAGYLGGHLVYAQGVGVDTNAFHTGPSEWQPVVSVDDLPEFGGLAVSAGRSRVLVVGPALTVRALENRCSHRGGPLSDGTVERDCVTCPWHGSRFDLATGHVTAGPATADQPVYQTRIRAGQVEVRRLEERSLRANPDGPG